MVKKIFLILVIALIIIPISLALLVKNLDSIPKTTKNKELCLSVVTGSDDIIRFYIDGIQQKILLKDGRIVDELDGVFDGCMKLHPGENKIKVENIYDERVEFKMTFIPDKKPIPIYDSLKFSKNIIETSTTSNVNIDIFDEERLVEVYADFTDIGDIKRIADSCTKKNNITTCIWNNINININKNKLAEIILNIKDERNNIYTIPILYQLYKKTEFSKNLKQGWNLISVPLVLDDNKIENVFSSISGKYNSIFVYDNGWKDYTVNKPIFLNTLTTIDNKHGYWIHMKEDATLRLNGYVPAFTNLNLQQGLNLISYPSLTLKAVKNLDLETDEIFAYDGNWKSYSALKPDFLNSLINLEPGFGYWIRTINQNYIYED